MGYIFARIFTEVAAYGSLWGFLRVCRAEQFADFLYSVFPFKNRYHHGAPLHKFHERRIVGFADYMRIVGLKRLLF